MDVDEPGSSSHKDDELLCVLKYQKEVSKEKDLPTVVKGLSKSRVSWHAGIFFAKFLRVAVSILFVLCSRCLLQKVFSCWQYIYCLPSIRLGVSRNFCEILHSKDDDRRKN